MRLLNLVPAVTLLAALTLPARAQQAKPTPSRSATLPLTPGARVRVSATTLVAPLVANYLEMRGDTAVFLEAGAGRGIWTLPVDQITRLELSKGDERYNRKPMLKGAAIGAPSGAFLFWAVTGLMQPSDSARQYDRAATAGAGFLVGGVVGALVGSRFASEGWMRLPLPTRVSVAPTLRDGRHGVAVRVALGF